MRFLVFLAAFLLLAATAVPIQAQETTGEEGTEPGQAEMEETEDETEKARMEIYGFVQADTGYDFGQNNPDWFDTVRPTQLPSYENEYGADGNTYFSVRQTRFGVKGYVPTSYGEMMTIFEWELFGVGADAGQTTLRLRHAYGELGQFGAGQYWSPFMDIDVFPNSLEYWGPSGMAFFRNVQVRWMPIRGDTRLTIALERPGASGDAGHYDDFIEEAGVQGHFRYPDLSGEFRHGGQWGYVEIAGILRRIEWVDAGTTEFDLAGGTTAWGFNLSTNIKLGPNGNTLKGSFLYGKGIENYMNDASVDIGFEPSGNPNRPLEGEALPVLGIVAAYDIYWNDRWTSSAAYSLIDIENTSGMLDSAFRRGQYALGNLQFHPTDKMMCGAEFQFGQRKNFLDDWTYNDYRIQFSFRYNYSFWLGG